jgi:hypothetical protein
MRLLAGIVLGICASVVVSPAMAADGMPVVQQNAIVQKHCAVCHNSRSMNGGLSLQEFDAASVTPSLAAMMLSKLTSGLPLDTVSKASANDAANAQLSKRLFGGAIMAAGIAPPDISTIRALSAALAKRAVNATSWHVSRSKEPEKANQMTASVLREVMRQSDTVESYRLILTCDASSRQGEMQLAWSPMPTVGTFSIVVDDRVRGPYTVEGKESMGNGVGSSNGLAAFRFPMPALPARSLLIRNLFPNETVEFSFNDLPSAARQALAPCLNGR